MNQSTSRRFRRKVDRRWKKRVPCCYERDWVQDSPDSIYERVVRCISVRHASQMSIFPITPLVRHVQKLIFETFDVSLEQAQDFAAELVHSQRAGAVRR